MADAREKKLEDAIEKVDLDRVRELLDGHEEIKLTCGRFVIKSLEEEETFKDMLSFSTLQHWSHRDALDKSYNDCKKITDLLLQGMIKQLWTHRGAQLVSKRNRLSVFLANDIASFLGAPELPTEVEKKLVDIRGAHARDVWARRLRHWTATTTGGRKRTRRPHRIQARSKRRKGKANINR